MMSHEQRLSNSLKSVLDGRGRSVGTAFHVTPQLCCTCTHVVAAALGVEHLRHAPPDTLSLATPAQATQVCTARVLRWDAETDLAVLELIDPAPADLGRLPLINPDTFAGRACRMYGFPTGYPAGRQAGGVLGGLLPGGLLQLLPNHAATPWIESGFSGGPVWDVAGNGVIGIVRSVGPQDAWAVPLAPLLALAPELQTLVVPPADRYTTARLANDLIAQGFAPLDELALNAEDAACCGLFDFSGVRWRSSFAFTIALLRGDGLPLDRIQGIVRSFAELNNRLYRDPSPLRIGWVDRLLTFTLSGVLCLVFEQPLAENELRHAVDVQFPGPTYGGSPLGFEVQTSATTLCWAIDLAGKRIQKPAGQQSNGWNFHVHWTNESLREIETLLTKRMEPPR